MMPLYQNNNAHIHILLNFNDQSIDESNIIELVITQSLVIA